MKHTKGPWKVIENDRGRSIVSDDGIVVSLRQSSLIEDMYLMAESPKMYDQLASARAIMQRFVDKVDSGRARSTETYAEMKEWLDD